MMKLLWAFCGLALLSWAVAAQAETSISDRCQAVAQASFANVVDAPTQVTETKLLQADDGVPERCQVSGYVAPQIDFVLLLPAERWNQKLLYAGCGGSCGTMHVAACAGPLKRGYACIMGDMGHRGSGDDELWGYDNLQAKIDYGVRSTHVTALAGKAITAQFYGRDLTRSYFAGCSAGGLQAMTEAERFPWDFDGIIAGALSINETGYYSELLWDIRALFDQDGKPIVTPADLRLVHEAAIGECDAEDGVKDGVIADPRRCGFKVSSLICAKDQHDRCLSAKQAAAVQTIYDGPHGTNGVQVEPGPSVGSELTWITGFLGENGTPPWYTLDAVTDMFRYRAFLPDPGPDWKARDFDFDRDYRRFGMIDVINNATNPDMRRFKAAGGKLLMYQGWNDELSMPGEVIDFYTTVERVMGSHAQTVDFARLFMIPGMNHCSGGEGAYAIDYLKYLEAWVEHGNAPDSMVAVHPTGLSPAQIGALRYPLDSSIPVSFSRPVFPYPAEARYAGSGDPNAASSFVSAQPATP